MIYKARYFLHDNFFKAKLGTNSSYAWRVIWEIKKILKERRLRRIGNGISAQIWVDPWIPDQSSLPIPNHVQAWEVKSLTVNF